MNPVGINGTLIIQLITFAILVALLYKYMYGPLRKVMDDRRAKIADGLAATMMVCASMITPYKCRKVE